SDPDVSGRGDSHPLRAVGEYDNWVVVDAVQARSRGGVVDAEKQIDIAGVVEVFGTGVAGSAGVLEPFSSLSGVARLDLQANGRRQGPQPYVAAKWKYRK